LDFIPSVKELPHNFDHHNKLLLDASNPLLWNIKKYETDLKNERKKQYISVRSLTFTPEGNYLIGGTISGSLYIWNALLMLSENDDLRAEHTKPFRVIENISSSAIHYFLVAEDLLFCGTDTDLRCFSWNEILNSKNAKPEFTINVPSSSLNSINFEINQIRHFNGLLYLATGDSRVHIFSIQEKKFIKSLVGHSGYVLCLELYNNCKIVSGDSEGFIKIWNMCDLFCESTLVPTFSKEMNGIFPPISDMCIDTSATWLVVLSGKHIVLWHLPSQTQTFCLRSHVLLRCICWVENTTLDRCWRKFEHFILLRIRRKTDKHGGNCHSQHL
jgi:WD40 repeat protein